MYYPTAKIDLIAISHNYNLLKEISDYQPIMVMVKANGYGHGIVEVANTLKEAERNINFFTKIKIVE
jgi:alanine racemase